MENIKEKELSPQQIFQNLKELRISKIDENNFWEKYLQNLSMLCKSSYIIAIKKDTSLEKVFSIRNENLNFEDNQILDVLTQVTEKSNDKNLGYESLNIKIKNYAKPFLAYFKLDNSEFAKGEYLIAIILDRINPDLFNEYLVRISLTTDIYSNYLKSKYSSSTPSAINISDLKSFELLEFFSLIRKEDNFLRASLSFVNEISLKYNASRVSLGWKTNEYIKTKALSNLDTFDKKSEAIILLETAFEECADQQNSIFLNNQKDEINITRCHNKYLQANNLKALVSFPIIVEDEVVGVLTLENNQDYFLEEDLILIQICIEQLAYWMNELYKKDKWLGARLYDKFINSISWYFGANNSFLKFIGTTISLILLWSIFFKIDYKIEAKATLETDNVAYLSAPYDGFVKDVKYHSGDEIKKDEILITLDSEELLLKEIEAQADVSRFSRETEKARANKELANMNISIARVEQAQSILKRTKYYLDQSQIKSPFDGIIVDGDKKDLMGSPVSKGDLLIKVANTADIYVKFKVSETDIDELRIDQDGELKLLSEPGVYYPIKVNRIIPLAQTDSESGNIFILKANFLNGQKNWWRPGMSGVTKINVGKKRVIWIATHKTIDFFKMYFWI